jgi:hypothetical protein
LKLHAANEATQTKAATKKRDFMTALPVEGFVDNDEEVLRLHGSPRTEAPYGCFVRYSRTASVASVHKANATA